MDNKKSYIYNVLHDSNSSRTHLVYLYKCIYIVFALFSSILFLSLYFPKLYYLLYTHLHLIYFLVFLWYFRGFRMHDGKNINLLLLLLITVFFAGPPLQYFFKNFNYTNASIIQGVFVSIFTFKVITLYGNNIKINFIRFYPCLNPLHTFLVIVSIINILPLFIEHLSPHLPLNFIKKFINFFTPSFIIKLRNTIYDLLPPEIFWIHEKAKGSKLPLACYAFYIICDSQYIKWIYYKMKGNNKNWSYGAINYNCLTLCMNFIVIFYILGHLISIKKS